MAPTRNYIQKRSDSVTNSRNLYIEMSMQKVFQAASHPTVLFPDLPDPLFVSCLLSSVPSTPQTAVTKATLMIKHHCDRTGPPCVSGRSDRPSQIQRPHSPSEKINLLLLLNPKGPPVIQIIRRKEQFRCDSPVILKKQHSGV